MNKIYDNGEYMIGQVSLIKEYNDKLLKENTIDYDTWEELDRELKDLDLNSIIMIDYGYGMGLYIKEWEEKDIVYGGKENE